MKRARSLMGCLAGLALTLAIPKARADLTVLVQWQTSSGGNAKYKELDLPTDVSGNYTWTQANAAASSTFLNGIQGHLVTVTSQAENDFLGESFSSYLFDNGPTNIGIGPTNSSYLWIGLFAPTPTSNFQWVTGETVSYTNWAPNEPNSFGTPFWQYAHYWTRDFGNGPSWTWNNEQNQGFELAQQNNDRYGYIVEFAAVPEPSSLLIGATGALFLIGYGCWNRTGNRIRNW